MSCRTCSVSHALAASFSASRASSRCCGSRRSSAARAVLAIELAANVRELLLQARVFTGLQALFERQGRGPQVLLAQRRLSFVAIALGAGGGVFLGGRALQRVGLQAQLHQLTGN